MLPQGCCAHWALIKNVITDVISERPMIYDKLHVDVSLINTVPMLKKSMEISLITL